MKYRDVTRKLKALGCEELPRRGGGTQSEVVQSRDAKRYFAARLGKSGSKTWNYSGCGSAVRD